LRERVTATRKKSMASEDLQRKGRMLTRVPPAMRSCGRARITKREAHSSHASSPRTAMEETRWAPSGTAAVGLDLNG
jgi:hypothetical protein